jgi:hypothetical protein
MFLVLILSFIANQNNTLCLLWQEVFQSLLKMGSAWLCPVMIECERDVIVDGGSEGDIHELL